MIAPTHEAEVARRFDDQASRFKSEVSDTDVRLLAVLDALAGLERPRVLDLGCGKGRFSRRIAGTGAEVVGVDLSAAMLSRASGHGVVRARASATCLPFPDAAFDAVVAIETLEHVGNLALALDEIRRVIRPGGRAIVVDKNRFALDARRPWLPSAAIKWIDERRGFWMYPAGGPVRERWFSPIGLSRDLRDRFDSVSIRHLLSPIESRRAVFRHFPSARLLTAWTAVAPGGEE